MLGPVFLPYLNAPLADAPLTTPPELSVDIGSDTAAGKPVDVLMDTGSTGVVISLSHLDRFMDDTELVRKIALATGTDAFGSLILDHKKLRKITYSSSGSEFYGIDVMRTITVHGAALPDGSTPQVTTRQIPVFVALEADCTSKARRCDTKKPVAMMGVGFAREVNGKSQDTPDRNPFLNLITSPSGTDQGYVVTRTGVRIGISENESDKGLVVLPLTKSTLFEKSGLVEYKPPHAFVSLNGGKETRVRLLIDTGVPDAFISVPPSQSCNLFRTDPKTAQRVLLPDVPVTIRIGRRSGGSVSYAFKVDDKAPTTPSVVHLIGNISGPDANSCRTAAKPGQTEKRRLNTGLHILNGYDYLFDYTAGSIAFRKIDGSSP
ncbi:MAG: hypothetical protein ACRYFY_05080 [Janthinobacterium lividum]